MTTWQLYHDLHIMNWVWTSLNSVVNKNLVPGTPLYRLSQVFAATSRRLKWFYLSFIPYLTFLHMKSVLMAFYISLGFKSIYCYTLKWSESYSWCCWSAPPWWWHSSHQSRGSPCCSPPPAWPESPPHWSTALDSEELHLHHDHPHVDPGPCDGRTGLRSTGVGIVGPQCVLPEVSLDQGLASPLLGHLKTERKVGVDLLLSQQERVLLSYLHSELTSSRGVGQHSEPSD